MLIISVQENCLHFPQKAPTWFPLNIWFILWWIQTQLIKFFIFQHKYLSNILSFFPQSNWLIRNFQSSFSSDQHIFLMTPVQLGQVELAMLTLFLMTPVQLDHVKLKEYSASSKFFFQAKIKIVHCTFFLRFRVVFQLFSLIATVRISVRQDTCKRISGRKNNK